MTTDIYWTGLLGTKCCAKHFDKYSIICDLLKSSSHYYKVSTIIILILQIKTQRQKKVKELA